MSEGTSTHLEAGLADHGAARVSKYEHVVQIVAWMVQQGFTPDEILDAVEKPHHYGDYLAAARRGVGAADLHAGAA